MLLYLDGERETFEWVPSLSSLAWKLPTGWRQLAMLFGGIHKQSKQKILVPWLSSLTHIFSASISLTFYRLSLSLSFSSSARCNAFGTQPGSARNEVGNKVGTKYKSFSATCNLHFGTICENNSFVFAKQIYRL